MSLRRGGLALRIALAGIAAVLVGIGIVAFGVTIVGGNALTDLMMLHGEEQNSARQMFDDSVTRVVALAALVAASAAGILAVIFARRLARPLREIGTAARRVAQGDYLARVPREGPEELASLADSFNQMAASLQEQERLRRDFIANAAHELRTPLTNLKGYLEAMRDGVVPADQATFDSLLEEADRLVRLARSLDLLAEGDAATDAPPVGDLDLSAAVRGAAELARPSFVRAGLSLAVEVPPELMARGNPDQLAQVLANLLQNAVRYTPSGGRVVISRGGPAGRRARHRVEYRRRDPRGRSSSRLRALLPRRQVARPRQWRRGHRPGHRPAAGRGRRRSRRRGVARRPDPLLVQPAGDTRDSRLIDDRTARGGVRMIRYASEVTIDRPVHEVFSAILAVEDHPRWMNVSDARWEGPAHAVVGARALETLRMGPFKLRLPVVISELTPDQRVVFQVDSNRLAWTAGYSTTAVGTGSTRVSIDGVVRFKGALRLLEPLARGEMARGEKGEIERLKELLEEKGSTATSGTTGASATAAPTAATTAPGDSSAPPESREGSMTEPFASRGFVGRRHDPGDRRNRIPPGQYEINDFPVLSAGPTPHTPLDTWTFTHRRPRGAAGLLVLDGLHGPARAGLDRRHQLRHEVDASWTCAGTASASTPAGAREARPEGGLRHRLVCDGGYTTNLPLPDIVNGQAFVAYAVRRPAARPEHGGPARLVVPHLYFWKSAKWVRGLRFVEQRPARLLGVARLQQPRRSVEGRALQRRLMTATGTAQVADRHGHRRSGRKRHRSRLFTLALPDWPPHRAGQHYDIRLTAEDGYQAQRSYSIASAPKQEGSVDLTVERLEDGEVSTYLHDVRDGRRPARGARPDRRLLRLGGDRSAARCC